MAVLKAPLFSFAASGKLADSLVFMRWKGLNDVRKYVIPTNPQTAAQTTQRVTNFKAAVTKWHTFTCSALDLAAWTLLASTMISKIHPSYVGVMSGFNAFMRKFVDTIILNAAGVWHEVSHITTGTVTSTGFKVTCNKGVAADTPYIYWGTTKTYMPSYQAPDGGAVNDNIIWTLAGLLPSTKYYFYLLASAANQMGQTGIYTQITTAA